MDKYEYKLRLEEIRSLNKKGRFQESAQVADTIDWKKVRNVSTLGIISDVYKINRRFDDAKAILLLANEQSPQNRRILYALCDLTIKMGQVVEAVEYYKEFVQMAPNDNNKYILLYKIYEAQDISLEERIAVLREYKKREYNEKWAYELAFLYHRVGLATECVEECDQLILWFGEGKYVTKAMELKMLYVPLSPAQQQAYDSRFGNREEAPAASSEPIERQEAEAERVPESDAEESAGGGELDIHVKPMDMGRYNTINLQKELAESMKEVLEPEAEQNAVEAGRNRRIVEGHFPQRDIAAQQQETPVRKTAFAAQPDFARTEQETAFREGAALPEAGMRPVGMQDSRSCVPPAYGGEDSDYLDDVNKVMKDSENWEAQTTGEMDVGAVDQQFSGQMNIEDVLAEWERLKRDNEEKRKKETKQWMLQQTGSLFEDFDQISRDGMLEKLQREEALPVETAQRDRVEDAEVFLDTADEPIYLEETDSSSPVRTVHPAPANATARAVLAAQGVVDGLTGRSGLAAEGMAYAEQGAGQREAPVKEASFISRSGPAREAPSVPRSEPVGEASVVHRSGTMQEVSRRMSAGSSNRTAEVLRKLTDAAPAETPKEETVQTAAEKGETEPQISDAAEQEAVPSETREVQETDEKNLRPEDHRNETELAERISDQQLEAHVRSMSREEKALFAPFVPTRSAMRQLVRALDAVSLSANTGNMIITGAPGSDMMKLAKNVIRLIRAEDDNFSGKIAKISGEVLNDRDPAAMLDKLENGALITEKAGKLSEDGANRLAEALNREDAGAIVFMLDSRRAIERLLDRSPLLAACFTARFDIAALDSGTLVKYGCQYAYNQEYAIDELGRLALHTRIEDMQTSDHAVTIEEVREIVDEAIAHAEKKSLRHFMDVLLRKRYDEDDMIVLREKDFI